jgi:prophage DNA circulation protein
MPDASPADLFTAYVLDVRVQVEAQLRQLTEVQQHMETWRAADDDAQRAALADLVERSIQQLVASNITVKQSVAEAAGLISTLRSAPAR